MKFPAIMPGKRAIIAGRTGSGKSTMGSWLLRRSSGHWVILNPKHTSAFDHLPDMNKIEGANVKDIADSISKFRYTVVNPHSHQATFEYMDALVEWLHDNFSSLGLFVDELYSIHSSGGKAGPGLTGWLTRGRELKQSFIGLTQRPAWISKFLFSEADYIAGMSLSLEADRKRMHEMAGHESFLEKMDPRQWLWYDVEKDQLRKFGPVPFKKN